MPELRTKKPANLCDYTAWLQREHGIDLSRRQKHYEVVAASIKAAFESGALWTELRESNKLRDFDEAYRKTHGNYPLVGAYKLPEIVTKPYDSFFLKTFRKNVIENRSWPNPPNIGDVSEWVLPQNWFTKINDIVRTCFVVKYLDGVEFLAQNLFKLSKENNIDCITQLEAREEGYYAAHLSLRCVVEIPKIDFDTETVAVTVELQITSQLQDVIRMLLHKHYEKRRERIAAPEEKWQWDYKSEEFATNYLGHILHYLEGMIVEVRDRPGDIKL